MDTIKGLYPFSTSDGKAIPFDVARPSGVIVIPFTNTEGSTPISLPTDANVVSLIASEECFIKFAATSTTALLPAENTLEADMIYVHPGHITICSIPTNVGYASVIGSSTSGTLVMQLLEKWSGIAIESQMIRR
jgi:hypothetical protein